MESLKYSLEYEVSDSYNSNISAIITCAGHSTRMKGVNKQFALISGVPVIVKSILAFQNNSKVSSIVISAKSEDIAKVQSLVKEYNLTKVTDIVCGGQSRAESVKNAFMALSEETDYVLIHDGARPFVSQTVIDNVINNLVLFKAVACGVPVKDTIKQVSENKIIEKTIDRNKLVAMQTPQGFQYELYKKALENASDISKFTDDCALVESFNQEVFVTEGDNRNIKITTKEDLIIAKAFSEGLFDD